MAERSLLRLPEPKKLIRRSRALGQSRRASSPHL
jgi:hypothetical protein